MVRFRAQGLTLGLGCSVPFPLFLQSLLTSSHFTALQYFDTYGRGFRQCSSVSQAYRAIRSVQTATVQSQVAKGPHYSSFHFPLPLYDPNITILLVVVVVGQRFGSSLFWGF